ncbi:MAG: prolyl-tRNA synthetase associated domain-containing protein [Alphaproteobacteria bacterium]|nr:prolyl-tRNA synthetase associated domain-containing protein [Alphaproteobacteria bacterium]
MATKTHHHPPLFTVDDSKQLRGEIPGGHCKSLFLKDEKVALFLLVALEDRIVDLKRVHRRIGCARLSFGKPELLWQVLGVTPGSVTPFALINDTTQRTKVVLDSDMLNHDPLNYPSLENTATTAIGPADLIRFIEAGGHTPSLLDFYHTSPE